MKGAEYKYCRCTILWINQIQSNEFSCAHIIAHILYIEISNVLLYEHKKHMKPITNEQSISYICLETCLKKSPTFNSKLIYFYY